MGGVRARRLALAAACHASVAGVASVCVLLGLALPSQPLFDSGGFLLVFHLLTFRRLPFTRWLQARLLRTYACSQCGLAVDLVAPWRCGCKYTSPERHAFSPCPSCGKGFAWVACPGCGSGILI